MDILDFRNIYWNYYIQMENDFFSYSPYCEIDKLNEKAFSIKYLQLLLSICGEIDSICKTFCKVLDGSLDEDHAGISDYMSILAKYYPTFANETVQIVGYRYRELQPWKGIAMNFVPEWWSSYNQVKHHRDRKTNKNGIENYKKANQKNVIEALSALYVLIEYWAAKNIVPSKDEISNNKNTTYDPAMERLRSSRLNLIHWDFYYGFFGQELGFEPRLFYKYLEGDGNP